MLVNKNNGYIISSCKSMKSIFHHTERCVCQNQKQPTNKKKKEECQDKKDKNKRKETTYPLLQQESWNHLRFYYLFQLIKSLSQCPIYHIEAKRKAHRNQKNTHDLVIKTCSYTTIKDIYKPHLQ